ncbi:hypothetical protein PTSG_04724 [Salpingoeca rosetta]|uniref:TKL protein kinase n=1 Tax=Salpingoeca rosetta (strain ATCC 50818 / BSB-021) TaxID=946362 RepID=F2U9I8_SALR5|nr:uncharacterized protein PTSG_04724 [Salpingoeca rosetta]EGD73015.1 hypothetical protein PTSG_04724 [Salpingoeca rosetta]|eukprot:XP_004994046.1 hypothetical protein PTSG_04724 [Salpingoeca rosetta]
MFVFGGLHVISDTDSGQIKYRVTNDLWMYFPDFKRWRNITQGGPTWPYPRFYHTANSINVGGKQNMVIFGGIDNSHVWTYNYESEEFNLFSPGAISPTPRMLHSSTSYNDTLYIYGGCAVPTGEVPGLDLCEEGSLGDVWRWTAGNGWEELLIAHPRIHRFSAAMFFYRGSLHMLGGFPHVSAFDHDTDADVNHYRLPLPTDWALADTPPPTWQAAITPETARPFEDVFDPDLDALSVDPFLLFNDTIRSLSFNVLPPRLGFASITQVSDDTFLLIAGRSSALTAPSNKVFRFNGQNMTWDVLDENRFDTNIARRSGHCSVATTAGSVLTFAGAAPLSFFSDVASFEAESQSWAEPLINTHPLTGIFPAGVTYKNYYVLHGGLSFARSEASSHVFLLDLSTRRWVNVWLHNQPPVRRYGHSVNVVGNNLYYFGGATALSSDPTAISNAIFRINMDEFNIYHDGPGITELRPHRRTRHSSVYFNVTHSLYVFGGRSHFSTYCDLWRFDIAGNFWQPLGNCTDNQGWPPARSAHVAFILDDFMYIYGGTGDVNVLADTYADVWRYDLTAQSWQHVADASPAGPRFSASVTPLPGGKKVIIALGIDNLKRGVSRLDLWDVHHVDNATSGDLDLEWTRLHVRNPIDRYAHAAGFHRFFRVFSGRRGILEDLQGGALEMEETALRLGCNVGSFSEDFLTIPCQPCPVGTFADFPGQESCFACPGKSTTLEEGSVSVTNCSVCEPNSCRGNGRCTIDQNGFRPSCFCNFGYSGADCSVNWLAIVLGTVLGGGSIVAIVFLTIRYFRRTIVQAKNDSALHQKLLAESQIELSLLERAWEIDVEDLTLYEQIGEGGYGEVYRALWNESVVALKKLRTAMAMLDSFFVDEFQTEVRLQRTLRHRNVVLFFGAGVFPDGNPFLVTEYMRRGSLQQVLASAWPGGVDRNDDAVIETINPDDRLSWGLRLQFARDAARGMTFLHEQIPPRLHRDIKV